MKTSQDVLGHACQRQDDLWRRWIINLIEDVRIESNGLKETPGYAEYLNYVREYIWSEDGFPDKWPDEPEKRFQIAIALLRYEDRIDEILTDSSFVAPREWLRNCVARYLREQEAFTPNSKTMIKFTNEIRDWLEIKEDTPDPDAATMMLACAATGSITREQEERIARAIEEEVEKATHSSKEWFKIFGKPSIESGTYGASMSSVVIRRPRSTGKYKASRGDLIEKAKAAITLRKTQAQHDTRHQAQGILDEDELYRLFARDVRVFKDATVESLPSAAIYLLVDMSGSMGDTEPPRDDGWAYPAYYATAMAQLLVEGLSKSANIKLKVLGHTGENIDNITGGSFYRIWEPGDSLDRLTILKNRALYSQNFDSWAIQWAGRMLQGESADQKLLIVLSDGQPGASSYGGSEAMDHVRQVSDSLLRSGVDVVQVSLSGSLNETSQARMFKHYIMADREEGNALFSTTLRKLAKLLARIV